MFFSKVPAIRLIQLKPEALQLDVRYSCSGTTTLITYLDDNPLINDDYEHEKLMPQL